MKAEELMISDWVLDGDNVAQVTGITCDGIIETTLNETSNIEVIHPIPLIPEILEKNGWRCEYYGRRQEWWLDKTKFPIVGYSTNDTLHHNGIVLKYVHELQHALRLCNIDKEIVL